MKITFRYKDAAGINFCGIYFEKVDNQAKRGDFNASAKTVESAIGNAFAQFAESELTEQ